MNPCTSQRTPSPPRRGSAKTTVLVLVVLLAAGAFGAYMMFSPEVSNPQVKLPEVKEGPMSEEERVAYVKAHVILEGLQILPDTKPDSDEPVPGLLRVKGEVENQGEQALEKLMVAVYPRDAAGEVVAAHMEDVLNKGPDLKPGARRDFSFTIPDRGTADGDFDHELR